MAKATYIYITGIGNWCKFYEHNKDSFGDKEFYSVDMLLDEDNAKRLSATGAKQKLLVQEDGLVKVKIRRNHENPIPEFGGPPVVMDIEGKPFTDLIGNGSKLTLKLCVYNSKFGKGVRLEKVRIDELVKYERPTERVGAEANEGVPF